MPVDLFIELLKRLHPGARHGPFPLIVAVLVRAGLADDVLDLPPGDEGIEEGLDHLLVGVGQMLDGLELAQEIAVGDAGGGCFVAGALEQ